MKTFTEAWKCTGCSACLNSCPEDAVFMAADDNGFEYPQIIQDLCSNCDTCVRVCPANAATDTTRPFPRVYAARAAKPAAFPGSSSGGIFSALVERVLAQGGVVCGAAFDNSFNVRHSVEYSASNYARFRGAKYVQSHLGEIFRQLKEELDQGRPSLFSGTSCQVDGFRRFLRKNYPHLLCVGLVCRGVPAPSLWQRYLMDWKHLGFNPIDVDFRARTLGWLNNAYRLGFRNSKGLSHTYLSFFRADPYGQMFINNAMMRPCCTACRYATYARSEDITLGDFWGINVLHPELYKKGYLSLVLSHTQEGVEAMESLVPEKACMQQVPLDWAHLINQTLIRTLPAHENQHHFHQRLRANSGLSFSLAAKKTLKEKNKNAAILTRTGNNYGTVLQTFALQTTLKKFDYIPCLLEPRPWIYREEHLSPRDDAFTHFRAAYLNVTDPAETLHDIRAWNERFDTFIVGSDQVWNVAVSKWLNGTEYFWGAHIHEDKQIIAYAASMGTEYFSADYRDLQRVRQLIRKFDRVSLREKSGVKLCRQLFGIDAQHVLDPTLLLDEKDYQCIMDAADPATLPTDDEYIGAYFICPPVQPRMNHFRSYFARQGRTTAMASFLDHEDELIHRDVPGFLRVIKNSKMMVTDSFHGLVFTILLKKPFVFFTHNHPYMERAEDLFKQFGIPRQRLKTVFDPAAIEEAENYPPIDYEAVHTKIAERREFSLQFLRESLLR